MTTPKHTPLPWSLRSDGMFEHLCKEGLPVGRLAPQHAEEILETLNSHHALKKQVEELREALKNAVDFVETTPHGKLVISQAKTALRNSERTNDEKR